MTAPSDGGPAFPSPHAFDGGGLVRPDSDGMSLRDWFAGQALVGLIAGGGYMKRMGEFGVSLAEARRALAHEAHLVGIAMVEGSPRDETDE